MKKPRWKFERDALRTACTRCGEAGHVVADCIQPRDRSGRRTALSTAQRSAVLTRDGHRCKKCRRANGLEIHHVLEVVFGGTHELANLDTLCTDCHAEWTWCQPPVTDYATWLTLVPARRVVDIIAFYLGRSPLMCEADVTKMTAAELLELMQSLRVLPEQQ